jgi:hypothetical protein
MFDLEDSSTYRAIIAKCTRSDIVIFGTGKFGEPDSRFLADLESVTDLRRLRELLVRILDVDSWQQLLDEPCDEPLIVTVPPISEEGPRHA